jgi:exopolysaccharide biosynthesis polyprenyl glycosylphosphotransferase
VYPDVFQIMASEVQISDLDGLPLLTMRDVALRGWRRTLKRIVDIVISVAALIVLAPLMLALAILVKLESSGSAFYVQERMGLDARPFPILKFRSMRRGAEAGTGAVWARRDDPRRTRLGHFMRRYNLDELPQLINVLLGHMSIVGPRPERPEFVAEFRRHIPRYMERHREKAGITGWAQVNGLRGDTSIEERTKYDLYYIENWSLLFDFKIMTKTVISGFGDPNAY